MQGTRAVPRPPSCSWKISRRLPDRRRLTLLALQESLGNAGAGTAWAILGGAFPEGPRRTQTRRVNRVPGPGARPLLKPSRVRRGWAPTVSLPKCPRRELGACWCPRPRKYPVGRPCACRRGQAGQQQLTFFHGYFGQYQYFPLIISEPTTRHVFLALAAARRGACLHRRR